MLGFDIETTGLCFAQGARISVVCTVDTVTREETVYHFLRSAGTAQYGEERERLLQCMRDAPRLCAFNAGGSTTACRMCMCVFCRSCTAPLTGMHTVGVQTAVTFDIPFMQQELQVDDAVVREWLLKLVDPLHAMRCVFKTTSSLNAMLALNGLECKSGSGAHAVVLAAEERWQELADYCLDDVRLTVALVESAPKIQLFVQHENGAEFIVYMHPGLRCGDPVPTPWATVSESPRDTISVR